MDTMTKKRLDNLAMQIASDCREIFPPRLRPSLSQLCHEIKPLLREAMAMPGTTKVWKLRKFGILRLRYTQDGSHTIKWDVEDTWNSKQAVKS